MADAGRRQIRGDEPLHSLPRDATMLTSPAQSGGWPRSLTTAEGAPGPSLLGTGDYNYDSRSMLMTTAAICATREISWSPSFYRGEQYDSDLSLYYLRARYYNPNTGRFMSRDPEDGRAPQVPRIWAPGRRTTPARGISIFLIPRFCRRLSSPPTYYP